MTMLKRRLPISDKTRYRLFRILFLLYFALFVPMIALNIAFYRLGSFTPDPTTGRTFPVNEHGILYVVPWEGELAMGLFWTCIAIGVLIMAINPYQGRDFPLRSE